MVVTGFGAESLSRDLEHQRTGDPLPASCPPAHPTSGHTSTLISSSAGRWPWELLPSYTGPCEAGPSDAGLRSISHTLGATGTDPAAGLGQNESEVSSGQGPSDQIN